ncbi:MAG: hypothetical protein HC813_04070 [Planctomycetes bacterium]|nr:hypothetical protein [Planctomycetota bacterium]
MRAKMFADVKTPIQDLLLKGVAILIGVGSISLLIWGLGEGAGAGRALFGMMGFFVALATAVGFWRLRGWAFLLASVGLLVGYLTTFVQMILAFNRQDAAGGKALLEAHLVVIFLIGFLGRWSIERRFRPHLETEEAA